MDRLNQLRGEPGGSGDSTLDTSSPPSEAFMTANESSSKYFSLSEVDSTFDISPIKDVSLASATVESEKTITESDQIISNLSPIGKKSDFDTFKIGRQIEAANILSGGVDIFDDNDNSYDGDELVIDDNAEMEEKSNPDVKHSESQFKDENSVESTLVESEAVPSKDTEVILQIDGKNVDAIDIGNGLYLYRKEGQEELAAVQIIDDDQQQPSFKFLKVRENNEGNLEVYEEIQIEVPKEVPVKQEKADKNVSHVPIKDISKVMSDSTSNKITERKIKTQSIPKPAAPVVKEPESVPDKEAQPECKSDSNTNKKMKFSESRKSPVIGSFTPMTFHSTPNKEGRPLTKTMVDLHLHPSRHSDNVKKTIEVHTDSVKQRILESPSKQTKHSFEEKDKQSPIEKDNIDTNSVSPLTQETKNDTQQITESTEEEKLVIDEQVYKDEDVTKSVTNLPNEDDSQAPMRNNLEAGSDKLQEKMPTNESCEKKDLNEEGSKEVKETITNNENLNSAIPEIDKEARDIKPTEVSVKNASVVNVGSKESATNEILEPTINPKIKSDGTQPDKSEPMQVTVDNTEPENMSMDICNEEVIEKSSLDTELRSDTEITKVDSSNVGNINDNVVVKSVIAASDTKTCATQKDSIDKPLATKDVSANNKSLVAKDVSADYKSLATKHYSNDNEPLLAKEVSAENKPLATKGVYNDSKQLVTNDVSIDSKPLVTKHVFIANEPLVTKRVSIETKPLASIDVSANDKTLASQSVSRDNKLLATKDVANLNKPLATKDVSDDNKSLASKNVSNVNKPLATKDVSDDNKSLASKDVFNVKKPLATKDVSADDKAFASKDISNLHKPLVTKDVSDDNKSLACKYVSNLNKPLATKDVSADDKSLATKDVSNDDKPLASKGVSVDHKSLATKDVSNDDKPLASKAVSADKKPLASKDVTNDDKPLATKDVSADRKSLATKNTTDNKPLSTKQVSTDKTIQDKDSEHEFKSRIKKTNEKHELISTTSENEKDKPIIHSTEPTQVVSGSTNKKDVVTVEPAKERMQVHKSPIKPQEKVTVTQKSNVVESSGSPAIKILPEEKKSNIAIDTQPTQILKDEKIIVAQSSNKLAVTSQEPSKSVVAGSDSSKTSKVDTPNTRDKDDNQIKKQDVKPVTKQQDIKQSVPRPKNDLADKKVPPKLSAHIEQKPINNNHAPVPFGKWTDVNRQAFLNKIKESKVPTNSSNGKQIKNSNDLNRRDILKKIDSQRQAQELANMSRLGVKKEAAFTSKPTVAQDTKSTVKSEIPILKNNTATAKKITKQEPIVAKSQTVTVTAAAAVKKESIKRKEINNQDLIDKTIEDIINRPLPVPVKNSQENTNQDTSGAPKSNDTQPQPQAEKPTSHTPLDAIEMKMNELHGIPFIERPAHELPYVQKPTAKSSPKTEVQKPPVSKPIKIPNLLPFVNKVQKVVKENVVEVDSEEEVIEHEPITGDMDLMKTDHLKLMIPEKGPLVETVTLISADSSKKETIITENDFDKFVRRNSISYENCLTVNFDTNEPHHNVVQAIVQRDPALKTYAKTETLLSDVKHLSPRKHEQLPQSNLSKPVQNLTKFGSIITEDDCNKNYQSKVKMAYQTAMTAKRQLEQPITIIEDKPVKVVFMDSNAEYHSTQLNVQGKELSPNKKPSNTVITPQISDSLDSDTLDSIDEGKVIDETKVKTKHQRKQVLTPVEEPELELIAPDDLGIDVSPKKKRRTEEKVEKNTKTLVPKKTYLLGRGNTAEETSIKPYDLSKGSQKETSRPESNVVSHKNTASAIDSLVKAAELLENQSAGMSSKSSDAALSPDSQHGTPMKRGRGRPRKYPLPEGTPDKTKAPSPQKKPRLIDAKVVKKQDSDDDDDDDSTDDEIVKENWTMGKINENIVCPICNKLFRSENVVFKHVKHCTGPSPSRSDSDNRSPRRLRDSQESETKSFGSKSDDMDIDETITPHRDVRKKRKSKEAVPRRSDDKDDIIVIEDTPAKTKIDRRDDSKPTESRKTIIKNKVPDKATSLVCEFCGKTFRQLSYLVSHKLQHGKEDNKKNEEDSTKPSRSVFSCETCKKEFRKLHHLVQHRIIHNPSTSTAKLSRKSSSEQGDPKNSKDQDSNKHTEDPSAGFRCEPCDKSFRKLHHLVEHRETHDGINRQKVTTNVQTNAEKLPPPPQCDICKKTFRKLHHLIEHKEQHLETSSEKSDDKSVKSSLSTKDIIHECSLCYMVFPNEHSLNKHTIICQRKKRQSATKQLKQTEEGDKSETEKEVPKSEEDKTDKDDDVSIVAEFPVESKSEPLQEVVKEPIVPKIEDKQPISEEIVKSERPAAVQLKESPEPEDVSVKAESEKVAEKLERKSKSVEEMPNLPIKVKKTEEKDSKLKVSETTRKKTPLKDKVAPSVTKRHKPNAPAAVVEAKPAESSDDDEIRYMLNPDYKFESNEGKLFMKVRANKRNSLQIERPNSKDLVKRRISLQHPPKVPRLKPKPIPGKGPSLVAPKLVAKVTKPEPVVSTDSDDSDVKYSFPEPIPPEPAKPPKSQLETAREPGKRMQRKSMVEKRKSLGSIAKRKSLGRPVGAKQPVKDSPLKQARKRTADIEHRCDCGQLFSSAALLSRHTTLAHTPPRIRRRRSPPPAEPANLEKESRLPTKRESRLPARPVERDARPGAKPAGERASGRPGRPRKVVDPPQPRKVVDPPEPRAPAGKPRRLAAHRGVPVPEKMRKLMEKKK